MWIRCRLLRSTEILRLGASPLLHGSQIVEHLLRPDVHDVLLAVPPSELLWSVVTALTNNVSKIFLQAEHIFCVQNILSGLRRRKGRSVNAASAACVSSI